MKPSDAERYEAALKRLAHVTVLDFRDPLSWGQWCRAVAGDALYGTNCETQSGPYLAATDQTTDTLEITYSGGEVGTPTFAVAKVIAKHPGSKTASLEQFAVDFRGTTVAAFMTEKFPGFKILSYRPVYSRPLIGEAQYGCEQTPLFDPALDFATDAMHGPKDAADPMQAETVIIELNKRSGVTIEEALAAAGFPAAPMSPEEQEKALAHLDAAFEADRQKVISEVMGMVAEPCPVCGQPNTPVHQEYEAAMSSASRAVADL